MTYLIVDLEATCCDRQSIPRREMEIIEIGAVAVRFTPDLQSFKTLGSFQAFVRPVRHPKLTPFCTRLTTISQQDVDTARGFKAVADEMKSWVDSFEAPIFCSWGDYDRRQLKQDCLFHRYRYFMPSGHVNIKNRFASAQGLERPEGMGRALRRAGLRLQGTHHRALDDVRNMVRLLPFIFGNEKLKQN